MYLEEVRLLDVIKKCDTARQEEEMKQGPLTFAFVTTNAKKSYEYMLISVTVAICRASIEAGSSVSDYILYSDRFCVESANCKRRRKATRSCARSC